MEYSELDIVGSEVYQILNLIPKDKYYKIPKKIVDIFDKYKNNKIELKIDMSKSFADQNLNQKTKDIMFAIALDYWLTDEERKKSIEKMKLNEEKAKEKYNVENIFKEKSKSVVQNEKEDNKKLIAKKETFLQRIFNKIKQFFIGKDK